VVNTTSSKGSIVYLYVDINFQSDNDTVLTHDNFIALNFVIFDRCFEVNISSSHFYGVVCSCKISLHLLRHIHLYTCRRDDPTHDVFHKFAAK